LPTARFLAGETSGARSARLEQVEFRLLGHVHRYVHVKSVARARWHGVEDITTASVSSSQARVRSARRRIAVVGRIAGRAMDPKRPAAESNCIGAAIVSGRSRDRKRTGGNVVYAEVRSVDTSNAESDLDGIANPAAQAHDSLWVLESESADLNIQGPE